MGFLHVGQSGASARNVSSSSMIAQTSENKTGGGAYEVDRPFFNCGKLRMALVGVAMAAAATMRSRRSASRARFLTSPRPPERFQRADTVTIRKGEELEEDARRGRRFPLMTPASASRSGEKGRKRKEPRTSEALVEDKNESLDREQCGRLLAPCDSRVTSAMTRPHDGPCGTGLWI